MSNDFHVSYYEADSFWSGDALQDSGNLIRVKKTIEMVPQDVSSLLDVGCGNGLFGGKLQEVRPDILLHGVDRSKAALSYVNFSSEMASIDNLPFPDDSYDIVSCLQVIEHLPNNIYSKSLSELARVSREYILIGVPFEENLEVGVTQCPQCRSKFNLDLHLRSYDELVLSELFDKYNFELIEKSFPVARFRRKYVNEILNFLRFNKNSSPTFVSPICPVCGYTEGDKTSLKHQAVHVNSSKYCKSSKAKELIRKTLKLFVLLFPVEYVKGYWVVALYKKKSM